MLIAIASTKDSLEGEISDKGARAPYFLIIKDLTLINVISNPFASGSGGAGFSVAKLLEQNNVEKFVAFEVGDNMLGALQEKNIEFEKFESTIKEYLNE